MIDVPVAVFRCIKYIKGSRTRGLSPLPLMHRSEKGYRDRHWTLSISYLRALSSKVYRFLMNLNRIFTARISNHILYQNLRHLSLLAGSSRSIDFLWEVLLRVQERKLMLGNKGCDQSKKGQIHSEKWQMSKEWKKSEEGFNSRPDSASPIEVSFSAAIR